MLLVSWWHITVCCLSVSPTLYLSVEGIVGCFNGEALRGRENLKHEFATKAPRTPREAQIFYGLNPRADSFEPDYLGALGGHIKLLPSLQLTTLPTLRLIF